MSTPDTLNPGDSHVSGVVTKDVRDRVASRLRSELDFEFDWVDVRRHTAGLDISWSGAPTEDEVRAVCASEGVATQAVLKRIRVWSCGQPHADRASAWAQHRLYGLEYVDGAIRADHLPELFSGDAHLLSLASSMITDIADCGCGHSTFEGVFG